MKSNWHSDSSSLIPIANNHQYREFICWTGYGCTSLGTVTAGYEPELGASLFLHNLSNGLMDGKVVDIILCRKEEKKKEKKVK